MAKLNRFTMPVFAGNAAQTQTSVFGSMKTSPQYTSDVAASVNTAAYGNGWADAVEVGYAPYMEDMNTLQKAITYQIAYSQQQGIPEWASDTEYYKGSLVKLNTASGSQIYSSLTDNNVGNLVSDTTKWKLMLDTANSYVTTNTTQTVTGAKTFSVSPIIPTATSGDSSTKAASTAFVKAQNYLTTVAKDLSYNIGGYIELSNDLIMLWGYTHRTGTDTSVTFSTPFGKQPCIIISPDFGDNAYAPSPRLVTTTSFDIMCKTNVDGYLWFAIGPKAS